MVSFNDLNRLINVGLQLSYHIARGAGNAADGVIRYTVHCFAVALLLSKIKRNPTEADRRTYDINVREMRKAKRAMDRAIQETQFHATFAALLLGLMVTRPALVFQVLRGQFANGPQAHNPPPPQRASDAAS